MRTEDQIDGAQPTTFRPGWLRKQIRRSIATLDSLSPRLRRAVLSGGAVARRKTTITTATDFPPRFITTEFTVCCDCGDDIWDGEPAYRAEAGTRCLICQAQIAPWVPDQAVTR
jgi:hypothetical protein